MFKLILLTLLLSPNLLSDIPNGKKLFDRNNCTDCHSTNRFKPREDKVSDFFDLNYKVDACSYNTHTGWSDKEVMDVSKYLNKAFYHFEVKLD